MRQSHALPTVPESVPALTPHPLIPAPNQVEDKLRRGSSYSKSDISWKSFQRVTEPLQLDSRLRGKERRGGMTSNSASTSHEALRKAWVSAGMKFNVMRRSPATPTQVKEDTPKPNCASSDNPHSSRGIDPIRVKLNQFLFPLKFGTTLASFV